MVQAALCTYQAIDDACNTKRGRNGGDFTSSILSYKPAVQPKPSAQQLFNPYSD
jgi:hypothetical protein